MFFADGDAVAVYALACAASEIYETHRGNAGFTDFADKAGESAVDCSQSEPWDVRTEPRNLFKHPGRGLEDQIVFSDEMNDFLLLAASQDCSTLCAAALPVEVQVYATWFRALYTHSENAFASANSAGVHDHGTDRIAKMLGEWFPGLRKASRRDQKRFGARFMEGVLAGRLSARD
jgi:hypothetical protein